MSTKRRAPAASAAETRSRVPCAMTRSNSLRAALDHRHEMDDALDALGRAAKALGVRDVAVDELAAPGLERRRLAAIADERTDVVIVRPQRVNDLRPRRTRSHR